MRYQTVLFDLDGTLLDTSPGIFSCIQLAANEMRIGSVTALERFIGPPLEVSAKNFLLLGEKDVGQFVDIYRRNYASGHMFDAHVYDGVIETLDMLIATGITLGVVTNKKHIFAVKIIEHFGLAKYFGAICGAVPKQTKADLINICLSKLGGHVDSTIYVGDTQADKQAAGNAGVHFAGVTWGFGFTEDDFVFNTPQTLCRYVLAQ